MRSLVLVAGFVLAACAVTAVVRAQLLSPGPLSRAHRELEGDGKCNNCHQAGQRVVDSLCTTCHKDIGKQRASRDGLHGGQWREQACGDCHVDHVGAEVSLVRWPGGSPKAFDHRQTGFALDNKHANAQCADCHKARTRSGSTSFIGASPLCVSCHGDPHKNRLGQDCASCHGTTSFGVSDFNHELTRYPLRGKHQSAECSSCHGEPASFAAMKFDDCASCHRSPHPESLGACKSCHVEEGFKVSQLSAKGLARMRQGHPGVALGNGHAAVACKSCHGSVLDAPPDRGSRCVDCHAPVHEADFGKRCERCHAQIRWLGLPDALGYRVHDLTRYPLVGMHGEVACASCHAETKPAAERYRALAHGRCVDCHQDAHNGALADQEHGECGACHTPHGFSPSSFGVAQHASTGFALDGMHVAAPCAACHGSEHPRLTFEAKGNDCQSCHKNPHGDRVDRELADGGCAHCHATAGWGYPRIDHSTWPLLGAHAGAACDRCHDPNAGAPRNDGLVDFARFGHAPRECAGCHEDPHAGQFSASEPVKSCDTCHDATSFKLPAFAHATLTRFPLTGAHAGKPCGDCHHVESLRNDMRAVRYRLGYAQCSDCHADPHGGGP